MKVFFIFQNILTLITTIKNNNALREEEITYTKIEDKIDEEEEPVEVVPEVIEEEKNEEIKEEVKEEEIPSRSEKKKEAKVDDDFFELIDSMYKERTDD